MEFLVTDTSCDNKSLIVKPTEPDEEIDIDQPVVFKSSAQNDLQPYSQDQLLIASALDKSSKSNNSERLEKLRSKILSQRNIMSFADKMNNFDVVMAKQLEIDEMSQLTFQPRV